MAIQLLWFFLFLIPIHGFTSEELEKLLPKVLNINTNLNEAKNACRLDLKEAQECTDYFSKLPAIETRELKNAMECFSKPNPTDCASISTWLRRKLPAYKNQDSKKTKAALLKNIALIEKHGNKIPGCFPNLEKTKKNLCFIKNNLESMEIKLHGTRVTPDGLFNDYTRYSEWLVLSTKGKDLELTTSAAMLSKGIDSLLINKTGKIPFEGGKNNVVGLISLSKRQVRLQNAQLTNGELEYYGRKIKTTNFGFGPDIVVTIESLQEDQSLCGLVSNPDLLLAQAIAKVQAGWDPNTSDKMAKISIEKAGEAGLLVGVYNMQDATKNAVESVEGLWKLITNAEMPDPKGSNQCVKDENKKLAAEFENKCSPMLSIVKQALGDSADKIVGTCFRQHCKNDTTKDLGFTQCVVTNTYNPVFQAKMTGCVGFMLNQTLGPAAAELAKKCFGMNGADEFSRCMANVSVIAFSAVASGGASAAIEAAGVALGATLVTAVNVGRITADSAKWLARIGTAARGASLFTVDMVLNPLPIDPLDLIKARKGLLTLLKEKNVPKDIAEAANQRVKEINLSLKDTDLEKITKNSGELDSSKKLTIQEHVPFLPEFEQFYHLGGSENHKLIDNIIVKMKAQGKSTDDIVENFKKAFSACELK
jgi:hypothetical protein